jgi:hypothetical protein
MVEEGRQDFKCKNCGKPVRELRLKSYCCDKCRTIRHREMRKEYMRTYQREYQRRYRALHKPVTAIIRHPTSAPLAH